MLEDNPYRPPESRPDLPRRPGWLRPVVTVIRVLVALWGLFFLAGPSRFAPNPAAPQDQVATKALGALLFVVAVFPFGKPRGEKAEARETPSEEL
jgi:hypothetical protein